MNSTTKYWVYLKNWLDPGKNADMQVKIIITHSNMNEEKFAKIIQLTVV